MEFTMNFIYTRDGETSSYAGMMLETKLSIEETKKILKQITREFYNWSNEKFVSLFLESEKFNSNFKIIAKHIAEGIYRGTCFYQPMFTINAEDGIYLEYHEYLFSCDPFF